MTAKMQILRAVQVVEAVLQCDTDLNCYAAGGCIRDTYYELPYKDIDIVVPLGDVSEQDAFAVMERFAKEYRWMMNQPVAVMMAYGQSADARQSLGDFDERLYGVVKVGSEYGDIDVLFSRYSTIQEVLDWFDCNINQGYMDSQGGVYYHPCKELVFIKPVSDSRRERMLSKWATIQGIGK